MVAMRAVVASYSDRPPTPTLASAHEGGDRGGASRHCPHRPPPLGPLRRTGRPWRRKAEGCRRARSAWDSDTIQYSIQ